jgi:cytidyltransferase-like protein
MTTGVVFGVFDGVHEGHRAMLREAHTVVERVIAVVPSDHCVASLKGKLPKYSWAARKRALLNSHLVEDVEMGDEILGEYRVLERIKPDVVFYGYDQFRLRDDLRRHQSLLHPTTYILQALSPFHPDQYKSSLLNTL